MKNMRKEVVSMTTAWVTGYRSGETAQDEEDRQAFEESSDPHWTFAESVVLQSGKAWLCNQRT